MTPRLFRVFGLFGSSECSKELSFLAGVSFTLFGTSQFRDSSVARLLDIQKSCDTDKNSKYAGVRTERSLQIDTETGSKWQQLVVLQTWYYFALLAEMIADVGHQY